MPKETWKILAVMVLVILLAVIVFLFVFRPDSTGEPVRAIPADASVIIRVNNFSRVSQILDGGNNLVDDLLAMQGMKQLKTQISFVDSLYNSNADVKLLLQSQPFFISAHFTGKESISCMFTIKMQPGISEKEIDRIVSSLINNKGTILERKYEGVNIREISLLDQQDIGNFAFTVTDGLFLLSFSTITLEDAIRQVWSEESSAQQNELNDMLASADKNSTVFANLFVNFKELPRSFSTLVNADFKAEVRSFDTFANWAELDMNVLSDLLLFNGFIHAPDSAITVSALFLDQNPQKVYADEILPGSVSAMLALSFSDIGMYVNSYKDYLEERGQLTSYNNNLKSLSTAYGTDFLDEFSQLIDNEITLALDAGSDDEEPLRTYIVMHVKSQSLAETKLTAILHRIAAANSRSVESYTHRYKFDNELSFNIYHLPVRKFSSKLFGSILGVLDEHYYVILDNFLVFSSDPESLQQLIRKYILNRTLITDAVYADFKNSLSPRSNLYFFCRLEKAPETFAKYLDRDFIRTLEELRDGFLKVQAFGFQVYTNNRMLYNNLLLKYIPEIREKAETIWESKLDTLMDFKPIFVVNHNTKQNEVFVQDLSNNIYLINQAGRILWKIPLDETINSDVYQVDYFKNGKLQFLFSSRNFIHLIDRNGNYVDKYPLRLRSPAATGLSLFDYDKNKDYRIFIPCEDRRIYVYTLAGSLVSGWQFDKSESEVSHPVQYVRDGERDYIIFGDKMKTYILDRKGSPRATVQEYFQKSKYNGFIIELNRSSGETSIVTTDTTGRVYHIYLNGQVRTVELSKFTADHYFEYRDLDGDGLWEYIFLDNNTLTVFSGKGKKLFEVSFREKITCRPTIFNFSVSDLKIGIVARQDNLIYLVNNDGSFYPGFPLQGNTLFSIGMFGDPESRFNLLVGSRDNFLYNYSIR